MAAKLISEGRIRRNHLGIGCQTVDILRGVAHCRHLKEDREALIFSLEPDSPAERAGLREGDVLVRAGETSITNSDDPNRLLTDKRIGVKITLSVLRRNQILTFTAIPEKRHKGK